MKIIQLQGRRPEARERVAVRDADVVINSQGVVVKDREGSTPRPATDAELKGRSAHERAGPG